MRALPNREGYVTNVAETRDGHYLVVVETAHPKGRLSAKTKTAPDIGQHVKCRMKDGSWHVYR